MASLSKLLYRILVTVLAGVAVMAQWATMRGGGAGLAPLQPSFVPVFGMGALASVVAAALALGLVWGTGGGRGSYALAVCLAAWSYVLAYSGVVMMLTPRAGVGHALFVAHFSLVETLGLAGVLRFSTLFPTAVELRDLEPPDAVPLGLRTLQRVRRALLGPVGPWVAAVVAFLLLLLVTRLSGGSLQEAPLNPFGAVIRFAAFTAAVLNLRISWLRSRGADRARMLWVMLGLTFLFGCLGILIGGNVLLAVTGWHVPLLNWRPIVLDVGLVGLVSATAMGVLRGGSVDASMIGRRVALLSGVLTTALFLAAALEALFADVLMGRIAVRTGVGTVLAVILMALAYDHLRGTLEDPLEHLWARESATTLD